MAWVTPSAQTTGDIITAAIWNQNIVDNVAYLKGQAGNVLIQDRLAIDNDANLYVELLGGNPVIALDSGDYFQYIRASNYLQAVVGGTTHELLVPQYIGARGLGLLNPQSTPGINYVEMDGGRFLLDKAEYPYGTIQIGFEWSIVSRAGGASTCFMRIYDVTNAAQIVEDSHATEDDPVQSPFAAISPSGAVEYRIDGKTDAASTGTYNAGAVNILIKTR